MRHTLLFLLGLSFAVSSTASKHFTLSENVVEAKDALFKGDYVRYAKALGQVQVEDSDNLFILYLKATSYTLRTLFYEGNFSPQFDAYYRDVKREIGTIKSARVKSKYTSWVLGELHFQMAMVQAKRKDNIAAASNTRSALIYLKKNRHSYPNFYGNVKTLALIKEAILALPSAYQSSVRLVGMNINDLPGKEDLAAQLKSGRVPKNDSAYMTESYYYLAIMDYYLGSEPMNAWLRIEPVTRNYEKDDLAAFIRLNFALKCHRNSEALECINNFHPYSGGHGMPILHLLAGKAKVQNLDTGAYSDLEKYIQLSGEGDEVGLLYLYYLDRIGGKKGANNRLRQIAKIHSNQGEQAKAAKKTAVSYLKNPPPLTLLKSRLLFDGGYYERALEALGDKKESQYKGQSAKLEYNYRKGRIYEEMGRFDLALLFYKEVLKKMEGSSQHYASYAALRTAQIYEKQGHLADAESAYTYSMVVCKRREYSKTVELKAKAGLKRVKKQ
jgi:tetratricopeptide (TPR) repeat protein